VLAVAEFVFVMDGLVVGVALPSIQRRFGLPEGELQWIVNAYTIALAGFLLLGGRLGDIYGRRRAFNTGFALFGMASLSAGLAPSAVVLIAARATQGLGAALATAAVFSLVTTLFDEGRERSRAFGILSGVGSLGVVAGAVLGGILTFTWGWESIFLLNVPISAAALVGSVLSVPESRDEGASRHLDLRSAVFITAALASLVAAIALWDGTGAPTNSVFLAAAAIVLFIAFMWSQRRSRTPLVPTGFFAISNVPGTDVTAALLPLGLGTCLFVGTLYLQNVAGFNALEAGLMYLPLAAALTAFSPLVPALVSWAGPQKVTASGYAIQGLGLFWIAVSISPEASVWTVILPGFLAVGVGAVTAYIPVADLAMQGVGTTAGLASGIFNASQHIGNAIGIAVLASVATLVTSSHLSAGLSRQEAATEGLVAAFAAGAALLATACLLAASLLGKAEPQSEPAPAESA
jgi:EmrB/QacA subfamily drug resistance transporter